MKMQKKLIIGLIFFSKMLSAAALRGSLPQVSRVLGQRLQSSINPIKSSFISFKPGQPTTFGRSFVSKTFGRPTNPMLTVGKPINSMLASCKTFIPQRGMSSQYMHNVQGASRSSWQGGAKLFGSLAGGLGLSALTIGKAKAEEYKSEEAAQLIGIGSIKDLANPNKVINFLENNDYKKNLALFALIVADHFDQVASGVKGAFKELQAHKTKNNLEKIRFLNRVAFDVNDLSKISLAEKSINSLKEALESLLKVQYVRADGRIYSGDVGTINQIKKESALSKILIRLGEDIELKSHLLDKLSQNRAYLFGYSGGLNDVEKQFEKAHSLFGAQLPGAYKELAEMILQDEIAYNRVKTYADYFPKLVAAIEDIEKRYQS